MKYVIVGSGVAGMTAAMDLARQADAEIHIYTEEMYSYYYRPQVTNFLAGIMPLEKVIMRSPAWYEQKGIALHLESRVARVEPAQQQMVLAGGEIVTYDRLLLTPGAHPFVPPIAGRDKQGVFTIRTLDDAAAIRAYAQQCERAVVIGGGLLGLEAARGIQGLGLAVTIVELAPRLMPVQLDEPGAALLQHFVEAQGFTVMVGTSAQAIEGAERVERVVLQDGRELAAELVVVATGVRPNTALAEAAGLEVARGIVVDAQLRTSAPHIYAAGDAAIFEGRCWGIAPIAQAQARIAAANMAGGLEAYVDIPPTTALKVLGIEVNALGETHSQEEGVEALRFLDSEGGRYRKLVLREGQLVGAITINDKGLAKELAAKILDGVTLSSEAAQALLTD